MAGSAVILAQDEPIPGPVISWSRPELLARYRRFREINKGHHSAVLKFLAKDAIISQARRIGLALGKRLVLDNIDDLNFVFDLLIYTAPKGRSRAIDRYARAAQLARGTDELLVLKAMQRARFSIIRSARRHVVAGVIGKDWCRDQELWLVDEGLESSLPDGTVLATRLYTIAGFAMTAGVLVPLDSELIGDALAQTPQLLRKAPEDVTDDRRFAEAIYRAAVARGIMDQVTYQDVGTTGAFASLPSQNW